jgi:hypothetical protein
MAEEFRPNSAASLTDLLSAAKNIVTALNLQAQTASNLAGNTTRPAISTGTLISGQRGRLCNIIVTTAGSTPGLVYDTPSLSGISASNLVYSIPNTLGVYVISVPVMQGIVIVPGTGQVITVSYS